MRPLIGLPFILILASAEQLSDSSKRLLFPDLTDKAGVIPSGAKLKLSIVIHRDAARTPTTERYLEQTINWTQCMGGKGLHPIKIIPVTPGGGQVPSKPPHEHKPLPGGCRMGVVTDVGMAQV
jgi:hypothetical protein